MPLSVSQRSQMFSQSEIRLMSIECEKVGGINLAQGVCDTEVPLVIRANAKRAIDEGPNCYSRYDGIKELKQSISRKMKQYNRILANPDSEIIVSAGSTGAFYCACLALLNPGDEVILFEPFYEYHVNTLMAVQAVPRFVSMYFPDWSFNPGDLETAITLKTKAIIINTPSNPSGKVFSSVELQLIAELAIRFDLFIFTDEIYEYFLYEDHVHISPGALPELGDRTITISGFSKTYSITGWRIGYCVCQENWAKMIGYMNDLVYVCPPTPLQYGVAEGLERLDEGFYKSLKAEYIGKRDRLCSALINAKLTPSVPQGAYYVLADVSRIPGMDSREKARYLLSNYGIASVPGEAFFYGGEGNKFVRLCFAKPENELEEACRRIANIS